MQLVTYLREGEKRLGVLLGNFVVDLESYAKRLSAPFHFFPRMLSFLEAGEKAIAVAHQVIGRARQEDLDKDADAHSLPRACLRPPVPRPGKIIAIGLNYRSHAAEQGVETPTSPLIFSKFPSCIAGPYDEIVIPRENPQVDCEVELGVVVGQRPAEKILRERELHPNLANEANHDLPLKLCIQPKPRPRLPTLVQSFCKKLHARLCGTNRFSIRHVGFHSFK
jgi:Fumarylacetoacetate (FAA) hydrolase family